MPVRVLSMEELVGIGPACGKRLRRALCRCITALSLAAGTTMSTQAG